MNYLDTSALIKRFVREVGSGAVDALITGEGSGRDVEDCLCRGVFGARPKEEGR